MQLSKKENEDFLNLSDLDSAKIQISLEILAGYIVDDKSIEASWNEFTIRSKSVSKNTHLVTV
jgi:hypothetical protein